MIKPYFNEQFGITFWFTNNLKEMEAKVQEDFPDYTLTDASGKMVSWTTGSKPRTRKNIGVFALSTATLAHECVHAAHEVMSWTDQKPDIENDEFFCYLVEDIFRQYCKHIKPTWNKEAWRI